MSNRYWGLIVVAVLGLTAYVFQLGVGVGYLGNPDPEWYQTYTNTKANDGRPNAVPEEASAPQHKQPCRNPESREESDLCAQWRAANAARGNVIWAERQFWVGVVTALGLGLTIFLTAASTRAAQRSALAAEKAVEGSDRPHLIISTIELEELATLPLEEKVAIKYMFVNYGKSPAWMTGHGVWLTFAKLDGIPDTFDVSEGAVTYWPIPPGQGWGVTEFNRETGSEIVPEIKQEVIAGTLKMLAFGKVACVDADGREHINTFVYEYSIERKRLIPLRHPFWSYT